MTTTCTVCGTVNPQGSTFCEGCGVELPVGATPSASQAEAMPAPVFPASSWDMPLADGEAALQDVPVQAMEAPSLPEATSTVPAPTSATTGPARLGPKKFGAPTGDLIPLVGPRLVVGRFDASSGPVDIDVSGMSGAEHISRRHAELYQEGGRWFIRDLGSTNGVYLKRAGEGSFSPRLQEPMPLTDGDELAFGNVMMSFHQD